MNSCNPKTFATGKGPACCLALLIFLLPSCRNKPTFGTPTVSAKTVKNANPVDSKGQQTAVALSVAKKTKADARRGTKLPGDGGAAGKLPTVLPQGVSLIHGYISLVALSFFVDADPSDDEITLLGDFGKLRAVNVKIENEERADPNNSPDFVAQKIQADGDAEASLYRSNNPFAVNDKTAYLDVITGDSAIGSLNLEDGTYPRFEALLGRNSVVASDHPAFGTSFYLEGTIKKGDQTIPLIVRSSVELRIRIDMNGSPTVVDGGVSTNAFVLNFDPFIWFDDVDLAARANGTKLVIDDDQNADYLKIIRANIDASLVTTDENGAGGDSATSK